MLELVVQCSWIHSQRFVKIIFGNRQISTHKLTWDIGFCIDFDVIQICVLCSFLKNWIHLDSKHREKNMRVCENVAWREREKKYVPIHIKDLFFFSMKHVKKSKQAAVSAVVVIACSTTRLREREREREAATNRNKTNISSVQMCVVAHFPANSNETNYFQFTQSMNIISIHSLTKKKPQTFIEFI